jgi:hypothetical protein
MGLIDGVVFCNYYVDICILFLFLAHLVLGIVGFNSVFKLDFNF